MGTLSAILAGFRRGHDRRATARALRDLSAAQLADIGIHSDNIDDVVSAMLASDAGRPAAPRPAVAGLARASVPAVAERRRANPLAA